MAYEAYFKLEKGASSYYKVTDFRCRTSRHHNGLRPDADATCELIELTVIVPEKSDKSLYSWYIDGEKKTEGQIVVELSNSEAKTYRIITYAEASCFAIAERYDSEKTVLPELTLYIAATSLTYSETSSFTVDAGNIVANTKSCKGWLLVDKSFPKKDTKVDLSDGNFYFTLERFQYMWSRERNGDNIPFGPTRDASLEFLVKTSNKASMDKVYKGMLTNTASDYVFLFNDTYADTRKLNEYGNYLLVRGYVVEVEEAFNKEMSTGQYNTMLFRVKMIPAKVTYDSAELVITED